jgi:hypothetical protein
MGRAAHEPMWHLDFPDRAFLRPSRALVRPTCVRPHVHDQRQVSAPGLDVWREGDSWCLKEGSTAEQPQTEATETAPMDTSPLYRDTLGPRSSQVCYRRAEGELSAPSIRSSTRSTPG